jgi:hypothetical protein
MAAQTQRKRLSLDTNLVLDLAEGKDFAQDFREVFQAKGYGLLVAPTVLHELHAIYLNGDTALARQLAGSALSSLRQWKIQVFDLDSTSEVIAQRFAQDLLSRGLIPEEEFNDGMILAETSIEGIPILVSSDKHLLDVDQDALLLAYNEAELLPAHPAHPKRLLRAMC